MYDFVMRINKLNEQIYIHDQTGKKQQKIIDNRPIVFPQIRPQNKLLEKIKASANLSVRIQAASVYKQARTYSR